MKMILIFFIVFPFCAISQESLEYSEVIEVSNVDKGELFIRGREWFNENFKSAKDVLQITDKESGELSGKGIMDVDYMFNYMGGRRFTTFVRFQMSVWVKDGKYKYEITNFYILGDNGNIEFGLITKSNETNIKFHGYSAKKLNGMYLSIKQTIGLFVLYQQPPYWSDFLIGNTDSYKFFLTYDEYRLWRVLTLSYGLVRIVLHSNNRHKIGRIISTVSMYFLVAILLYPSYQLFLYQ